MSFSFANLGANSGSTEKKTGTLFGSTTAPAGGLFGQSSQQPQANTGSSSLFGSAQPTQPAQNNSLFGNTTQQNTGGSSLFGQPQQQQQKNAGASLFGQSQQQQTNAGASLFGQSQQQQQQQNSGSSLFGQPQQQQLQQQQQQSQQQPAFSNSLFGASLQPAPALNPIQSQAIQQQRDGLPQLRQSAAQPYAAGALNGAREKSVVEQIRILNEKWDPQNPKCVFQAYFYNKVDPSAAPFYGPTPDEDPVKWDEALSNKPAPEMIPALARGFEAVAARITNQNAMMRAMQTRLHEMQTSLILLKDTHELDVASRITEAKRKHVVSTQRTLALATKVQILRNRGYVMDQQEEELKKKLVELEKKVFDPVLGGRQEEIWARMSGVRERARILQEETEKLGKAIESQQNGELLSEDDQKALEKLLQDYDRQLEHLKKWVVDTQEEYDAWETEQQARPAKR